MTRLPHRVRVRPVRASRPLAQFACPGCNGRYQVYRPDAGMWATYHARSCPALRDLNLAALRCWNCEGAGRVASKQAGRWVADECLVCLGRGWTTEPDPTRSHP